MMVMMMSSAKIATGETTFMMLVVVMVMPSTKVAARETTAVMVMSSAETASAVMSVTHGRLLLVRFFSVESSLLKKTCA